MNREVNSHWKGAIKIAIADDHEMFRTGIAGLLREQDDMKVVVEAANGKDLINQLKKVTPHIVLMDVEMPEMNGIETMLRLKDFHPDIKLLFLTVHSEPGLIFEIIRRGAHGFLSKENSATTLIDAIYSVMDKGFYLSAAVKNALIEVSGSREQTNALPNINDHVLTAREIQILKLICQQKTSREIAEMLSLSERTVHSHRTSIHLKTKTRNMVGLALYALKHHLIIENEIT